MITVSRLDGSAFVVNAELIELIETTPDTVLSLTSGKKLVVRESMDELVERVLEYHQRTCCQGHASSTSMSLAS